MHAPRYTCKGCGRKYDSEREARRCELNDLVKLMKAPPESKRLARVRVGF